MKPRVGLVLAGILWMLAAPAVMWPTNRRMRRAAKARKRMLRLGVSGAAAISFTNRDAVFANNVTSLATSSISPTADRLLLVGIAVVDDVNIVAPTVSTTLTGVTLRLIGQAPFGSTRCALLYGGWTGAAPGSGTITADWGASSMQRILIIIDEVANTPGGANGAASIAQVNGYPAASLAASRTQGVESFRDATNNANFAFWLVGTNSGEAITERSGWTKLAQPTTSGGSVGNAMSQYLVGEDSSKLTGASWTNNAHSNIVHVEIRGSDSALVPGPVTRTSLTTFNTASVTSFTTASVTVPANHLGLLCVTVGRALGPDQPTVAWTTSSDAWVLVNNIQFNTTIVSVSRISVFRYMGTANVTDTVTITMTNSHSRVCGGIIELGGVRTTGSKGADAVVQSATNASDAAANLTVTLSAFTDGRNATVGFFSTDATQSSYVAGTGFLQIDTHVGGTNGSYFSEFCYTNDTSVDASWSGTPDNAGIALEVAFQPVSGITAVKPRRFPALMRR